MRCCLTFLLSFFAIWGVAQEELVDFPYYPIPLKNLHNDSGSFRNTCAEDKYNRLWFGEENGLSYYDGIVKKLIDFKNEKVNKQLNLINDLCIDNQERIWLASKSGLFRYDYEVDSLKIPEEIVPEINGEAITKLLCIRNELWIGTKSSDVYVLDLESLKYKKLSIPKKVTSRVSDIRFCKETGFVFISTITDIYRISKDQQIEHIFPLEEEDAYIGRIYPVDSRRIVFNNMGKDIHLLDFESRQVKEIEHKDFEIDIENIVAKDFIKLPNGKILVSNNNHGFYLLDIEKEKLDRINTFYQKKRTFPTYFTELRNGNILALGYKEILFVNKKLTSPKVALNFKSTNHPSTKISQYPKDKKSLIVGVRSGFLIFEENKIHSMDNILSPEGLEWISDTEFLTSIYDPYKPKLNIVDVENKKKRDLVYPQFPDHLITTIYKSNTKPIIYLGTNQNGILEFNYQDKKINKVNLNPENKEDVDYEKVMGILELDNKLYSATQHGLIIYDKSTMSSKIYTNNNSRCFQATNFDGIVHKGDTIIVSQHKQGAIGFSHKYGPDSCYFFKAHSKNDQYIYINDLSIKGNTLIQSNYTGISMLDLKTMEQVFLEYYGLCNNYHPSFSSAVVKDEVLFSSGNAIHKLHIDKIDFDPPKINLNHLIYNKHHRISAKDLNSKDVVKLPASAKSIEVDFSVVDFYSGKDLQVFYRLRGIEDEWYESDNFSRIYYPGLTNGEYVLECKAINVSSLAEDNFKLTIVVHTPWYKTIVFYILFYSLVGFFIYGFFRYRLRTSKNKRAEKAEFEKRISDLEMEALRSQMNPHFLFNSLNSIKYSIIKEDKRKAAHYVDQFSKLIRLILQNSRKQLITLREELDALKLYVQVEQMRFEDNFQYKIHVDKDLDQDYFEIPPLILQPFVENALWHGLQHKEGFKELIINVHRQGEKIFVEIIDNGVGLKKSKQLPKSRKKESLGMKITEERMIQSLKLHQLDIKVSYQEAFNNAEYPGTKVILEIVQKKNDYD